MEDKKCGFIYENGKPCGAFKVKGLDHCFSHSPQLAQKRKSAGKKGAMVRHMYLPADSSNPEAILPQKINLTKSRSIKKAYAGIIRMAFLGLDERRVGTLIYALNGYCAQIEKLDLLARIEKLESIVKEKGLLPYE